MIYIKQNSPIQYYPSYPDPNTYYLNNPDFDSRFFFTSDYDITYYMLLRVESNGDTKVISSNKLVGHPNGTDYDYRFDFDKYILINNQVISNIETISGTTVSGIPIENNTNINHFYGTNVCKIYLCLSSNNMVEYCLENGLLTKKVNGDIVLPFNVIVNDLPTAYYHMHFNYQKEDNLIFNYPNIEAINGTVYPLTIYGNHNVKVVINTSSDTTQYIIPKELIDPKDYNVYLLNIPKNCINIQIYILVNYIFELRNTINTVNKYIEYNDYFFLNDNGVFEVLRCEGLAKNNDSITKQSLQVGNKLVHTKININKKIVQNTGFKLTQEQIYGLIKAPVIYSIDGTKVKEYSIDTNSFEGYNGKKLSEKNIELMFIDPKQYQRKTNFTVGYFD